jgi:hypothetical protein
MKGDGQVNGNLIASGSHPDIMYSKFDPHHSDPADKGPELCRTCKHTRNSICHATLPGTSSPQQTCFPHNFVSEKQRR